MRQPNEQNQPTKSGQLTVPTQTVDLEDWWDKKAEEFEIRFRKFITQSFWRSRGDSSKFLVR